MLEAIIFDVFGTLIDTGEGSLKATAEILKKYNPNLDPNVVYSLWKEINTYLMRAEPIFRPESQIFLLGLKELYREFNIEGDAETDVGIMLSSRYSRKVFPETMEVIDKLRKKYLLVLASNTDNEPLQQNLAYNGLQFSYIFTSEDLRIYKPKKQFFEKVLTTLCLDKEKVVFVGDSQADDVQGPSSVGIQTIWLNRKREKLKEEMPKPLFEIYDLKELLLVLEID